MNSPNEVRQARIMSQWIVSLGVSIVCCAVLFLVFARYIIEIHSATSLAMVRIDVLQDRQNQLVVELDAMRRPIPVMITNGQMQPAQIAPAPVVAPVAAPSSASAPVPAVTAPITPPVAPAASPETKP